MSEIEVIEKKQKQHAFSSLKKKKLNAAFVKPYIIKISNFLVLFEIIIDKSS